jgi:hypothetical protein
MRPSTIFLPCRFSPECFYGTQRLKSVHDRGPPSGGAPSFLAKLVTAPTVTGIYRQERSES